MKRGEPLVVELEVVDGDPDELRVVFNQTYHVRLRRDQLVTLAEAFWKARCLDEIPRRQRFEWQP